MAVSISGPDGGGDDQEMSVINTTPLVDVMLVLLIIFLITIPVVTQSVPVTLPKEINQPNQTKPENVVIAVDAEGRIYWNTTPVDGSANLLDRLRGVATLSPQPEVHIRGDRTARYDSVGKVVAACQRAGIVKIGFITEPPVRGG
jgi:biopolymer transport protein ExbD